MSERFSRSLQVGFIILAMAIANAAWYSPQHASAAGANMYLFWDPANGVAPSGWTVITTYNGYFPYGETTTGTFGALTNVTGRPYTPTTTSITQAAATVTASANGSTITSSSSGHVHPNPGVVYSADTSSDTSNPDIAAFRSLQLIKYSGIPSTIPQYAIAMFSGTLPSGNFTRVSANDNRLIEVNSTVANGGSDTETNTVWVSGLDADTNTADQTATLGNKNNGVQTAPPDNTHAAPATLSCTTGCTGSTTCTPPATIDTVGGSTHSNGFVCTATGAVPPYVEPVLGQATANIPTISVALTAIFDGDPGAGWAVLSNSGGTYYHKYLRPAATYSGTAQGSATRTMVYSGASGTGLGTPAYSQSNGSAGTAGYSHTHALTITANPVSNMVPSFNVIIAEKVSFTLNAYRWYVDTSAGSTTNTSVTDPWPAGTGLDVAQDTQLPAIPAQYLPPDAQSGTMLRLRVQILVSGQPLTANSTQFKLQYQGTGAGDCLTGSWTDVAAAGTAGAPWTYGTDSLTDNQTLAASALSPTSTRLETFGRSASVAAGTPTAAASGETIEFDWLIKNNSAATGTEYHFRPVERPNPDVNGSATPLSLYQNLSSLKAECPDLITKPGIDQEMRHGDFFLSDPDPTALQDPDQGYAWVD